MPDSAVALEGVPQIQAAVAHQLHRLAMVDAKKANAVKEAMDKCAYWRTTLRENAARLDTSMVKSRGFDAKAAYDNGEMTLEVSGRVDSMSAPTVLAFWEKVSKEREIVSVTIDCGNLTTSPQPGFGCF